MIKATLPRDGEDQQPLRPGLLEPDARIDRLAGLAGATPSRSASFGEIQSVTFESHLMTTNHGARISRPGTIRQGAGSRGRRAADGGARRGGRPSWHPRSTLASWSGRGSSSPGTASVKAARSSLARSLSAGSVLAANDDSCAKRRTDPAPGTGPTVGLLEVELADPAGRWSLAATGCPGV